MKVYSDIYSYMTTPEALFAAWKQFRDGKGGRKDVMAFEWDLERHIFDLHKALIKKNYVHGSYFGFFITDPKQRHIHKAQVRDRIVHHAVFKVLNAIFEPTFIDNSFSCRVGKGTHKGVDVVETMQRKVSRNYTRPCFALKCDIRRFFDSVDHQILLGILGRRVKDEQAMWLIESIIKSYTSDDSNLFVRKGLPLGNLTSQLFANIYMNQFDQFVKHVLKVKHYARYTDDFIIISDNRDELDRLLAPITNFLQERLQLQLHPKKVFIRKVGEGVDFLGYVLFPHYRRVRTKTKKRMIGHLRSKIIQCNQGKLERDSLDQSIASYWGVLSHANAHEMSEELKNNIWFWLDQPIIDE